MTRHEAFPGLELNRCYCYYHEVTSYDGKTYPGRKAGSGPYYLHSPAWAS